MTRNLSAAFPLLWALLLAETFFVSLFFHGIHDIRITAILGGLLVFGYAVCVAPGFKTGWLLPKTASAGLIATFMVFMGLSALWSSVPYISILFAMIIGTLPFLFFCIVLAPDPQKLVRICTLVIGAVMTALAIWALLQFFVLFHGKYGERVHHPLLDPNNLAVMFAMMLVCALGFFMQARARRDQIIGIMLTVLFYFALLATQSRGGLLASAAAAFIMVAFTYRETPELRFKLPLVLFLIPVIFFALDYSMGLNITESVTEMASPTESISVFGRHAIWLSTLRMGMDHFWGGVGLGNFYVFYPSYRMPYEPSDGFFAHMDPLQFFAEMGVFAPILFYSMLTAILLRTSRALGAGTGQIKEKMQIAAPFCALLALLLHSHINFHLYVLPILFPAGVLLAYWYLATENVLNENRVQFPRSRSRRLVFGGTSLAFLIALIWVIRAGAGVWFITDMGRALTASDVPRAEKTLAWAKTLAPGTYSSIPEYEARLNLMKMNMMDTSVPPEVSGEFYRESLVLFDKATKLNPRSPYALNFEALMHFKAFKMGIAPDGDKRAVETLKKLLEIDPLFILGRTGLAEIYLDRGNEEAALKVLMDGMKWPKPKQPLTVRYIMTTADLHRKLKNDAEMYGRLFREAKEINAWIVKEARDGIN